MNSVAVANVVIAAKGLNTKVSIGEVVGILLFLLVIYSITFLMDIKK